MNTIKIICIFLLTSQIVQSQSYIDEEGNTQLWGQVDLNQFDKEPYSDWFQKNSTDYTTSLNKEDSDALKNVRVKVFIGTWCGDTKFLFPKFMKTWNELGLSTDQLEVIALHHEGELYKQGPNNETKGLDVHRVPTFIFYNKKKEIGRIVERTVFDLDADIKLIAHHRPYQHRYKAVSIISELMYNNPDSLHSETFLKSTIKKSIRELSTEAELNIYAYTLFFAQEYDKAEFVFKLNKNLFPFDPYIAYGYGRSLFHREEYALAKEQFLEALRIKPDFERATHYLNEIYEAVNQKL